MLSNMVPFLFDEEFGNFLGIIFVIFFFFKMDPEKNVIFFSIPACPACGHCEHFYTF